MSYILEALKISEQSRRQRDGLHYSLLPAVEEGIATRPFRPYLWLAGALLINATAVALWWYPALPAPAPAPASASAEMQIAKAQPESAAAMPRATAPSSLAVSPPAALPALLPEPLPDPAPVLSVVANQPPAPLGARPTAATTKPPQAKLRAAAPEKTDEAASRSDNADATSASLMKQLPPISIAGYIRDAEANRLVMVNDRLLREGDELAPGLKLEKILDDSLVFNFRGHRFKR